jgi:hypothetical protein
VYVQRDKFLDWAGHVLEVLTGYRSQSAELAERVSRPVNMRRA